MKNNITKLLCAVLAFGITTTAASLADKPAPPCENKGNLQVKKALEAAGVDDETAAKILEALGNANVGDKEAPGKAKAGDKSGLGVKVESKTVIIGPDGKVRTLDSDEAKEIDLGKLLSGVKLHGAGKGGGDDPKVQVRGEVSVIGPDGKKTTKDLKLGEGLDLGEIIGDAMKGGDVGELGVDAEAFSFGPAVLMGGARLGSMKGELEEIRAELKAQRKLLEKILKKLD